jgi:hypothetical protein
VIGARQAFHGAWVLLIPLAMLGWVAFGNSAEDQPRPYRALKGAASEAEADALGRLMGEAYGTLRSEAFQQNLRGLAGRYPAIYARRNQQDASPDQLADYVALEPLGSRFVNADVILIGGTHDYHAAAGQGPGEGRFSDIVLGRFVMAHWRADDLVRRSCAINVAAHEYAHTISTNPFVYEPAFTDTQPGQFLIPHRKDRTTPVASYLIGAVAQCTWLQAQGRIVRADVPACVEAFGVASGNDERCGAFPGDMPVAPRPGLPPLNPNL